MATSSKGHLKKNISLFGAFAIALGTTISGGFFLLRGFGGNGLRRGRSFRQPSLAAFPLPNSRGHVAGAFEGLATRIIGPFLVRGIGRLDRAAVRFRRATAIAIGEVPDSADEQGEHQQAQHDTCPLQDLLFVDLDVVERARGAKVGVLPALDVEGALVIALAPGGRGRVALRTPQKQSDRRSELGRTTAGYDLQDKCNQRRLRIIAIHCIVHGICGHALRQSTPLECF